MGEGERDMERQRKCMKREGAKVTGQQLGGIINQISHNPLRRGPSLGLVWTRSTGRRASIGVATLMLTVAGSEGEGLKR